jgi:hypothetical protein
VNAIAGGNLDYALAIVGDGKPTLVPQPSSASAFVGETATLTTLAVGSQPLSYQWQFHGTNISGATSSSLTLVNVSPADVGQYTCIVRNSVGVVTNSIAFTVANHPPTLFDVSSLQLADDGFHLRLAGLTAHGSAIIYASTNLLDWQAIYTNAPSVGTLDFVDVDATNTARFYRAAELP